MKSLGENEQLKIDQHESPFFLHVGVKSMVLLVLEEKEYEPLDVHVEDESALQVVFFVYEVALPVHIPC